MFLSTRLSIFCDHIEYALRRFPSINTDRQVTGMNAVPLASESDKTAASRERADRRRSVLRTIREQRERLVSTSGTRPAFDHELALTFARNRISAIYALPLLIAIVAIAGLLWIKPVIMIAWAAVVLTTHVGMIALCRKYTMLPAAQIAIKIWTRRFVIAEFIGSITWASVLLLMPASTADVAGLEVFQFATMLIV